MKELGKLIQKINNKSKHRTRTKQVFDDLIQLGFNLLTDQRFVLVANPMAGYFFKPGMRQELSTYREEPECWELLQEAFEVWLQAIRDNPPFTDILGMLYDEHLGEVLGQFLTPPDVAKALPYLLDAARAQQPNEPKVGDTFISDPCGCGAGSLLLAQISHMYETKGVDPLRSLHVRAVDIDLQMVRLTSFQLAMSALIHQLPLGGLEVHHGHGIIDYGKYASADISERIKTLAFFYTSDKYRYQGSLDKERSELAKASESLEALIDKTANMLS